MAKNGFWEILKIISSLKIPGHFKISTKIPGQKGKTLKFQDIPGLSRSVATIHFYNQ